MNIYRRAAASELRSAGWPHLNCAGCSRLLREPLEPPACARSNECDAASDRTGGGGGGSLRAPGMQSDDRQVALCRQLWAAARSAPTESRSPRARNARRAASCICSLARSTGRPISERALIRRPKRRRSSRKLDPPELDWPSWRAIKVDWKRSSWQRAGRTKTESWPAGPERELAARHNARRSISSRRRKWRGAPVGYLKAPPPPP